MEDLPYHVDAGRRFVVRQWKLSSYHRFTIWMLPGGEPVELAGPAAWDDRLVAVGHVEDANLHGDRTRAKGLALTTLAAVGYEPGMPVDRVRELLRGAP